MMSIVCVDGIVSEYREDVIFPNWESGLIIKQNLVPITQVYDGVERTIGNFIDGYTITFNNLSMQILFIWNAPMGASNGWGFESIVKNGGGRRYSSKIENKIFELLCHYMWKYHVELSANILIELELRLQQISRFQGFDHLDELCKV